MSEDHLIKCQLHKKGKKKNKKFENNVEMYQWVRQSTQGSKSIAQRHEITVSWGVQYLPGTGTGTCTQPPVVVR